MKHVECLSIFVILLFCSLTITMYLNLTGNFPRIPAIIRTTIDNNTLAVLMKRDQLLEQKMLLINKTFHTLLRAHHH